MKEYTGIRQIIADIAQECIVQPSIQEGVVKRVSPLKVGLVKDKKMELGGVSLIVPDRLSGKLDKDDRLHLLVVGGGKQYYVLDKV